MQNHSTSDYLALAFQFFLAKAISVATILPTPSYSIPNIYRVFIKYCVFLLNVVIFLDFASSAAAPGVWPAIVYTHTDTMRGNRESPESRIYFQIFEKNTIFPYHPVCAYGAWSHITKSTGPVAITWWGWSGRDRWACCPSRAAHHSTSWPRSSAKQPFHKNKVT